MTSFTAGCVVLLTILVAEASGTVHISFNGKDMSGLQEGEPIKIIEGHDLLLECMSSYANSSFIWTKDGRHSSFNQVKNVTQVQVMDQGVYNCQATSYDKTSNTERVEKNFVSVEILYPPSYPIVGSVFIDGPHYALHGEDITLTCKSDSNPEPNYQWHRGNKTGPLLSRNANYRLIVQSYIMDYFCIVNNNMVPTIGEAINTSITRKLQIRVYVKAYIFQIEGGIYRTITEGDSVNVECTAYGRPPPNMWWTKSGDDSFYLEGDQLSHISVTQKFAGDYFCNAENTVVASNQSRIKTHSKQKVHITVNANSMNNTQTENDTINDKCLKTTAEEKDSKNIALFILAAIGWLGCASSTLIHIIICTKNRNKKRDTANRSRSIATTESNSTLSSSISFSNLGISGSYSDLTKYDNMKPRSFSVVSSTNSEYPLISSTPSMDSYLPKTGSPQSEI